MFRSRLESRIAAFLDLTGITWAYEPFDLKQYIPDLLIELPTGPTILECKPAIAAPEFREPCRRVTRSGWAGPALVIGSQLSLAPDDRADLTLYGTCAAEVGGWARVGRGRWPAKLGAYPFGEGVEIFDRWAHALNATQWKGIGNLARTRT